MNEMLVHDSPDTVIDITAMADLGDLITQLRVGPEVLARLSGRSKKGMCEVIAIPKEKPHRTRFRHVHVFTPELRRVHRAIAVGIAQVARFGPWVTAYLKDGSNYKNALPHVGRSLVARVDLEDFFGSITIKMVSQAFEDLNCSPLVALALARICTVEDRLPQGGRASPIISNLVANELDRKLLVLAGPNRRYTRYADDITISGDAVPTERELAELVEASGFRLRSGSYMAQTRGRRQYVTGLSVAAAEGPNIPRAFKRSLRFELFQMDKRGLVQHLQSVRSKEKPDDALDRIFGSVAYVKSVEPRLGSQFWLIAKRVADTYRDEKEKLSRLKEGGSSP